MTKIAKTIEKIIGKNPDDRTVFAEFDRACIEVFPCHFWIESDYNNVEDFEKELKNIVLDYIPDNYQQTANDLLLAAFHTFQEGKIAAGKVILTILSTWMIDYKKLNSR